ncbi:MAG: hypothetical protein ABL958_20680, partial [Bdellovibrionia bacterium]
MMKAWLAVLALTALAACGTAEVAPEPEATPLPSPSATPEPEPEPTGKSVMPENDHKYALY